MLRVVGDEPGIPKQLLAMCIKSHEPTGMELATQAYGGEAGRGDEEGLPAARAIEDAMSQKMKAKKNERIRLKDRMPLRPPLRPLPKVSKLECPKKNLTPRSEMRSGGGRVPFIRTKSWTTFRGLSKWKSPRGGRMRKVLSSRNRRSLVTWTEFSGPGSAGMPATRG